MRHVLILVFFGLLIQGCSVKKMAVNSVADAISGGGDVWMSDDDPELIRAAIPFGLKTNESLLAVSPDHVDLLEATAKGFTAYAFLLTEEADRVAVQDLPRARRLRARASKLFLRGRDYALRGLEIRHPGLRNSLGQDRQATLATTQIADAGLLYWAGVAWAGAVSTAKDNLTLVAELPVAASLVRRVLELDETYGDGTAHEFFVGYEAARPGGNLDVARGHYERALQISGGERASVYLALAESVSLPRQDVREFRGMLASAQAIDPDSRPGIRLINVMAQDRAAWLEEQIPRLFLVTE